MTLELRAIREEEWEAYAAVDGMAFGFTPTPERLERTRRIYELDRSLAVFDGEEIVSTTGIFSFQMTVPGGSLPVAGVTWVAVKPTHRRRGLLRMMMERQLRDVHERGEPFAALWASESVIYGRFGYGLAAEGVELAVDREHALLAHRPPSSGRLRLVTREQALSMWPRIYDRVLASQPGMYSRSDVWWSNHVLREDERAPGGWSERFCVQYEEEGEPLGYARYRVKHDNDRGSPNGTLAVQELVGATDAAYGALWDYLFGVDLMGEIIAHHRPVQEPLYWMLADPRRLVRRPYDTVWVRLVDVPGALEGRRYASEGRVVLDVHDAVCDWVAGRYELEGGPDGARCTRTDRGPDVSLSAAELGAAYLGGMRLSTMQRAGRVEGDAKAVARADAMLQWDPAPWCPEVF